MAERFAYLNHAGVCPLPEPVVVAMRSWAQGPGASGTIEGDLQEEHIEEVRALAARLMGVAASEVAFVKNTTEGLGFVANGLDLREGDRVVVSDREFPSTVYPWIALEERGVVVDRVTPVGSGGALPVEAFVDVMSRGAPPKVVATSWVQFALGWRTDLEALASAAHEVGALLCADVIQGLGVLPVQLAAWGVDFAMADAHKWLLGPPGIGVLYVRSSCIDRLRPLEPGWASVAHREEWDNLELVYDDSARRFEGGSANACGVYGLGAALELLLDAGVDAIWRHVDSLCDLVCERVEEMGLRVLSERSPDARSGIVTFALGPGLDPVGTAAALLERGVVCSPRGGGIRVSPHGHNTEEDVERLATALRSL